MNTLLIDQYDVLCALHRAQFANHSRMSVSSQMERPNEHLVERLFLDDRDDGLCECCKRPIPDKDIRAYQTESKTHGLPACCETCAEK